MALPLPARWSKGSFAEIVDAANRVSHVRETLHFTTTCAIAKMGQQLLIRSE
jgi:hypothetical protein